MTFHICEKRRSILDERGAILITGGPGSGKTTIAMRKAQARIEEGLNPGQSVLFLSFSRSAVGRAIETSKSQLSRDFQRALHIQTFHSFFWEVLSAYGYLLGTPRRLRLLAPQDESAMRHGIEAEGGDWTSERERLYCQDGLVAFDLFATKTAELFDRSTAIRTTFSNRHPLIVVDEAQDTAQDQWDCVRLLSKNSQLVCLADLEQQIYDFRPGVSSERVNDIMEALKPLRVDLAGENHRSAGSEIVNFANDILLATPRGTAYRGVARINFTPNAAQRDTAIRQACGRAFRSAKEAASPQPVRSLAFLATWGRGVNTISRALTGDGSKIIAHKVSVDEASVLLSSRLIAHLLEPRPPAALEMLDLADCLDLAAAVFRARGKATNLTRAQELAAAASSCRAGTRPRSNSTAGKLLGGLRQLRDHSFSGDPKTDWIHTRNVLNGCGGNILQTVAKDAEQLVLFQRGTRIANGLTDLWQTGRSYRGAKQALDTALAEDQLLSGFADLNGIHVMTIHKAKGKEFDAVVIFDDPNSCPLIGCANQEADPHNRCRRVARVAITRARHHVLMLVDRFRPSALLDGHSL